MAKVECLLYMNDNQQNKTKIRVISFKARDGFVLTLSDYCSFSTFPFSVVVIVVTIVVIAVGGSNSLLRTYINGTC